MQEKDIWGKYKNYLPYFIVIIGLVLTGVIYLVSTSLLVEQGGFVLDETISTKEDDDISSQPSQTLSDDVFIMVYVCGAVKNPGVYCLKEDSRLVEAIEAAGGFTENAWKEGINLARTVVDAEQIYVMTEEERIWEYVSMSNQGDSNNSNVNTITKLNLNTATKEQLMELPGIGEAKAESIISYRKQVGAFSSIEDIMNISGIKQSVFQKIKEFITV